MDSPFSADYDFVPSNSANVMRSRINPLAAESSTIVPECLIRWADWHVELPAFSRSDEQMAWETSAIRRLGGGLHQMEQSPCGEKIAGHENCIPW